MLPGSGANPDTSERGGVVWVGITVASFLGRLESKSMVYRDSLNQKVEKKKLPSVWEILNIQKLRTIKLTSMWRGDFPRSNNYKGITLLGTNISHFKGTFESMIFLFPRWDMLIPWWVESNQVDQAAASTRPPSSVQVGWWLGTWNSITPFEKGKNLRFQSFIFQDSMLVFGHVS